MEWSAQTDSTFGLRNIQNKIPSILRIYEKRYKTLDEMIVLPYNKTKYEHEMKNLKRRIDYYKKQLYTSRIELILRHDPSVFIYKKTYT